jgi:hypothetical protein
MPTQKSLIGVRVPASAEFVGAFTNPKAARLVYRYSILPRIVSVIAFDPGASSPTIRFGAGSNERSRSDKGEISGRILSALPPGRLSRSVAFIAALMDSRGFDLAIADLPGANRLTFTCSPPLQSTSDRRAHTPCPLAAAKARGIKLGNPKQTEINRAKATEQAQSLAPAHRALHRGWPHVEQCDRSRSQRARHRGTEWWSRIKPAPQIGPLCP